MNAGQPNGDVGAALAKKPFDSIRIGKAKQDCQGNDPDSKDTAKTRYEPVGRIGNCRLGQPDAHDHGDRAGSCSQWQGQRIEGLVEQTCLRGSTRGLFQLFVASSIEKLPSWIRRRQCHRRHEE